MKKNPAKEWKAQKKTFFDERKKRNEKLCKSDTFKYFWCRNQTEDDGWCMYVSSVK